MKEWRWCQSWRKTVRTRIMVAGDKTKFRGSKMDPQRLRSLGMLRYVG